MVSSGKSLTRLAGRFLARLGVSLRMALRSWGVSLKAVTLTSLMIILRTLGETTLRKVLLSLRMSFLSSRLSLSRLGMSLSRLGMSLSRSGLGLSRLGLGLLRLRLRLGLSRLGLGFGKLWESTGWESGSGSGLGSCSSWSPT